MRDETRPFVQRGLLAFDDSWERARMQRVGLGAHFELFPPRELRAVGQLSKGLARSHASKSVAPADWLPAVRCQKHAT